jgi:hypothetical protein
MVPTDRGVIRVAETDDKLLIFDISDDALERAAPIIGGVASVVTLNFGTAIVGNCACPCMRIESFDCIASSPGRRLIKKPN